MRQPMMRISRTLCSAAVAWTVFASGCRTPDAPPTIETPSAAVPGDALAFDGPGGRDAGRHLHAVAGMQRLLVCTTHQVRRTHQRNPLRWGMLRRMNLRTRHVAWGLATLVAAILAGCASPAPPASARP